MKRKGYEAAQREFSRMREDYEMLRACREATDAMEHWSDFIGRMQRIYNKLTAAAIGNGKSKEWMDRQNSARKSDELISYLHQARHADEHGLQDIGAEEFSANLMPPLSGSGVITRWAIWPDGRVHVEGHDQLGHPLVPEEIVALNRFKLVDVTNRGVLFKAPTSHFGNDINPKNIEGVCRAVLRHMETLLAEAARLVS